MFIFTLTLLIALFESVVNSHWEGRVSLRGEAMHCLGHSIEEIALSPRLTTVAVWRCDQLFGLRYHERSEKIWVHRSQAVAQPDIEEVRQVGVPHIVVIRWIG